MQNKVIKLFEQYTNCSLSEIYRLPQSGGNRVYFRILGKNGSVIGVVGNSTKENNAFFEIARQFEIQSILAPKVLCVSDDKLCYLLDDLGDNTLFDRIADGRTSGIFSENEKRLLYQTMGYLPDIQFKIAQNFDFSVCYPQSEFDRRMIFFDFNYFKYSFLKLCRIDFDENRLENEFEKFAEILLQNSDTETFMYRDFQSRNVMFKDDKPCFIDFQGGRKGAIYYDVASFLWQARANFPNSLRNELIDTYLISLKKYCQVSKNDFLARLKYFVLFRQLQTLGAYGFRGIFEQKQHFLQSIPFALENIDNLLPFNEFTYLSELLKKIVASGEFQKNTETDLTAKLTVQIESFAYGNGIPKDSSGNGGGYVFDCRSIYNPGRFEQYKKSTGLDSSVKEFIENSTGIEDFIKNVYSLIDSHIKIFLERGFWHLSVFFGCTGGQHRSVYCAELLAKYVKAKYPVNVKLRHRELGITREL
ncbi:MAG: phosphotransferase [Prevotellaceae bacterium]|jgi:aminoglycoside/choline kinase family phosphotransferase|nr:phosphotransferase [Prevotellaceae bacterium]